MTRRQIVKSAGIGAAAVALSGIDRAQAQNASVKALVFDTFGTVVDWRGSIVAEGNAWGKSRGITVDWGRFADRWRAGYAPSMEKVRKGEMPWTNLDHLHRALLEDLLREFRINGLSEEDKDHWNRVWHRLKPWPDSVAGLTTTQEEVHDRAAVERQRRAACRYGQTRRSSVGPDSFGGAGQALQARS